MTAVTTALSRRREVGSASARSLLLTVLGEFVYPRAAPVWTGTLVTALGTLGVEEKSARQALSRSAAEGLLVSTRHGRRVSWELTDAGTHLLEQGTGRIYGFMRERRPWDGRWLVLTVAIPETQRQLRHRLRTRLTWLGLGSPAPGLWVVPDFAWVGSAAAIGDQRRLLADAWELDGVSQRYVDFVADFGDREVSGRTEAFVAQVRMVQEWRRFPFLDPDLPAALLAHDWPGPAAAAAFHDRHARWHRRAQDGWDRMDAAASRRT
jgi:phenylacetic acid degradation operon negative regulatory protein